MYPEIFGLSFLHTYGVLVAAAFLAALWLAGKLAREANLSVDSITNLGIYCALAAIAGAKLMMFLIDIPYYAQHPGDIFSLSTLQAVGVFYGGLLAALGIAVWYMRKTSLPGWKTADVFAPAIALGHGIGRLGCFSAGCCWGIETKLPWAVTFHDPAAALLTGVPLEIALHPAQLYESGAEALAFGFLYWRFGRPHAAGQIIGLYLVISSVLRFLIEFTRNHEQALPFGLPLSITQWIAIGLAAAGAVLLVRAKRPAPVGQPVHA